MRTKRRTCAPPIREHSQQTLGAHEGSGRKRHQEEHARQRGQALLDSTPSQDSTKAFSSAISHALLSVSLEVRHCQTPPFFSLILFLYSNLPLAWDSKLNATCTKPKRTCHSSRNIILLENQRSLYILELPFSFSKDTSQLPTCSYVVYSKQPNMENNIANTFGGVTNGSSGQTQRTAPEAVSAREKFKTKNTATLRMCADFLYSFAQERTLLCSSRPSPHGRPK